MAFDPATLNPAFWVRADSLSALADGDPVSTWPDLSASPNDLTAAGADRPTYHANIINGLPVVRFNASNFQTMKTADATHPVISQPYTIFVVGKAGGNSQTFVAPYSGLGGLLIHRISGAQHFEWLYAGSNWFGGTTDGNSNSDTDNFWAIQYIVNGASSTHRMNGRVILGTGSPGTSAMGGVKLGSCADIGGYWLTGDIAEVLIFPSALSVADQWNVNSYLQGRYALDIRRWRDLVFDGDSLTDGYNLPESVYGFPAICCHILPSANRTSLSISGWKLDQLEADAATRVDPSLVTNGDQQSLMIWAGINDVNDGASGQTVFDRLTTYCNSRRAAGWPKIITATLTNQGYNLTNESARLAFNTLLRANWASISDAMVDLQALAVLADYNNTTYFNADKLHLAAAGYAAVGVEVRAAIDALLVNASDATAIFPMAHYSRMRRQ